MSLECSAVKPMTKSDSASCQLCEVPLGTDRWQVSPLDGSLKSACCKEHALEVLEFQPDKIYGTVHTVVHTSPSTASLTYSTDGTKRLLTSTIKRSPLPSGIQLGVVSLDQASRSGLCPFEVAVLDMVVVDSLNVKHITFPFMFEIPQR